MNCKQNSMLDNPFIAYAHHRIILDESGKSHDYEYLEVNAPFEKLSELKKENLLKRTVRETFPHILGSNFDWIATFGQIALEGGRKPLNSSTKPQENGIKCMLTLPKRCSLPLCI